MSLKDQSRSLKVVSANGVVCCCVWRTNGELRTDSDVAVVRELGNVPSRETGGISEISALEFFPLVYCEKRRKEQQHILDWGKCCLLEFRGN